MINDYTISKRAKIEEEAGYIAREEQELDFLRRGQNILQFKVSPNELEARVKTIMRIAEEAKQNEIVPMLERKIVYSKPEAKPKFVKATNVCRCFFPLVRFSCYFNDSSRIWQAFNALSDLPLSNGFDDKSFPTVFFTYGEQEALLGKDLADVVSSKSFSAQRKQETKIAITEAVKRTILRSAIAYCPSKVLPPRTHTLTNWDLLRRESMFTAIDVASERRQKMHRARCIARACATVVRFPRRKARIGAQAVQSFWRLCAAKSVEQLAPPPRPVTVSPYQKSNSCLSHAVSSSIDNKISITPHELEFAKLLLSAPESLALVELEDQAEKGFTFQSAYHNLTVHAILVYLAVMYGSTTNVDPFLVITSEKNQSIWDIALSHLLTKRSVHRAASQSDIEVIEMSSSGPYNSSMLINIFVDQRDAEKVEEVMNSGEQVWEGQTGKQEKADMLRNGNVYNGGFSDAGPGDGEQDMLFAGNARVQRVLEGKTPFLVLTSRQASHCSPSLAKLHFETIFADDFEWDSAARLCATNRITFMRTSDPSLLSNERLWKWWRCTFGERGLRELKPGTCNADVRQALLSMLSQSTTYLSQGQPKVSLGSSPCVTAFNEPKPVVCERAPFTLSSQLQSAYDQRKEALLQLGPNAFIDHRELLSELVFDTKVDDPVQDVTQIEVETPLVLTPRSPFVEHFSLLKQSIPVFLTESEKITFMRRNAWLLYRYFLHDVFLHLGHPENSTGVRVLGDGITGILSETYRHTFEFFKTIKTQAATQERHEGFVDALDFFKGLGDVSPYNLGDEAFSPFWVEELCRTRPSKKVRLESDTQDDEILQTVQRVRALRYQAPFGLECIKAALIDDRSMSSRHCINPSAQTAPLLVHDKVQLVLPTETALYSLRESCYIKSTGIRDDRVNDFFRTFSRTVEQKQSQKTLIVAATCAQAAVIAKFLSGRGTRFVTLPKMKEGLDFFVEKFNRDQRVNILVVAAHFLGSFTLLPNVSSIVTFFHCEQVFLMAKELSQQHNSSAVVTVLEPRGTILCCTGKGAPQYATAQTGFTESLTYCDSCRAPVPRRLSSVIEHASPLAWRYENLMHVAEKEKQTDGKDALLPPLVRYCKRFESQAVEKVIKRCRPAVKIPVPPAHYLSTPALKDVFRLAFPSLMHPLAQLSKLPAVFPAHNSRRTINPFKMFSVGEPFKLNEEEQLTPLQDYMLLILLIIINKVSKNLLPANRSKPASSNHIKTKTLIKEASEMVMHGFSEESTSDRPVPKEGERIWSREEDCELLTGIAKHRELRLVMLFFKLYHPRFYPPKSYSQYLSRYHFLQEKYDDECSKLEKPCAAVPPSATVSPLPQKTQTSSASTLSVEVAVPSIGACKEPDVSSAAIKKVLASQHDSVEPGCTFIGFIKKKVILPKKANLPELEKASRNVAEKLSGKTDDEFWSIGSGDTVQKVIKQRVATAVAPHAILPAIYQTARNEWVSKSRLILSQVPQGKTYPSVQQYHQQPLQSQQSIHHQQPLSQQPQQPQQPLPSAQQQVSRQMPPVSQSQMYGMGLKNGILLSDVGQGFSQREVPLPLTGQFAPRLGVDGGIPQAPLSGSPKGYPPMVPPRALHVQGRPLIQMYQPHPFHHQIPPNASFGNGAQQPSQIQKQRQQQPSLQLPPPQQQQQQQSQQQQQQQGLSSYLQQRQQQQSISGMEWVQNQMALRKAQPAPPGYQQAIQMNGGIPQGYIRQPSQSPPLQSPMQGYQPQPPSQPQQSQQQQLQYTQPHQTQMQNGMGFNRAQQIYIQQQEQQQK